MLDVTYIGLLAYADATDMRQNRRILVDISKAFIPCSI